MNRREPCRGEEASYYPIVARWLKRHFRCFKVEVNKGIKYGIIDAFGVRDVGGELSGDIETIAIEVKKGATRFATVGGQALAYNVYANRVYLAVVRPKTFTQDELHIASHLGIGLVHVRNGKCKEVLSSPLYNPIPKLNLWLLERLRLGKCRLCGSFFETGDMARGRRWSNVTDGKIRKALEKKKGTRFWLHKIDERKGKSGISTSEYLVERRFICPDCIQSFFSECVMR